MTTTSPSVQELIDAYRDRAKSRDAYMESRKIFEADQNGTIEEIQSPLSIPAGVVLLRVRRGRIPGLPLHEYRIKLSHAPIAPKLDELIRLLQGEERRAAILLNSHRQELITRRVFAIIVYLLNVSRAGDNAASDSKQRKPWHAFLVQWADIFQVARRGFGRRRRVPITTGSSSVDASGTKSATDEDLLFTTSEERISLADEFGRGELARIQELVDKYAQQSALGLYLLGLVPGVILSGLLVFGFHTLAAKGSTHANTLSACLASGAVGATVSAMTRITNLRKLDVAIEQGKVITLLAGGFRPIVGSIIGVVFYILIQGGLLPLNPLAKDNQFFFYVGLAFLAGFSERWAQDAIVSSTPKLKSASTKQEEINPTTKEKPHADTLRAIPRRTRRLRPPEQNSVTVADGAH